MPSHRSTSRVSFASVAGVLLTLIFSVLPSPAQDEPPASESRGVRLQFLPPPMEGAISLGVYDAKGKLIRVLKREATTEQFTVALNGLITFWDGKNDAGEPMPAGNYSARGFLVGEFAIEGRAYHCNDWIADEKSPRIKRIDSLELRGETGVTDAEHLFFQARRADGKLLLFEFSPAANVLMAIVDTVAGQLVNNPPPNARLPALESPPLSVSTARQGGLWLVVQTGTTREVREYSASNDLIRRLSPKNDDPQPVAVAASSSSDTLFLLEENTKMQRARSLQLIAPAPMDTGSAGEGASTWKTLFEKKIVFSDTLDQVREQLKLPGGKPFVPQEKVTIPLRANPLEQNKPGKAEVTIATDAKGSYLKLTDGLPLTHLTETPNLKWAAMARDPDGKRLTIFQSDGAVVEEFQITKIANMMAFDCGDFDYTPRSE